MAFPDTYLDLLVEGYLGRWVDLSDRLTSIPVVIPQRGAPTGAQSAAAGSCTVALTDDDGALTPLNPSGEYYPHVRRGTPFRVVVRRLNDTFARTESAGWGAGWSAIGAGGSVGSGDSSVSGGQGVHAVPAANAFRATYNTDVSLSDVEVRCVVEMPDATITGGPVEPANLMLRVEDISTYYLVRVSVDTSEAVTVALHHTVAGELAAPVSTGITYSGQRVAVAAIAIGPWVAAKVWNADEDEPRDWQIEVVDHTYAGRGYCGVRSGVAFGNSDTKPIIFRYNSVEVRAPRMYGAAASYRPTIVPGSNRRMVAGQQIEIGGILRQLERRQPPVRSAMVRTTVTEQTVVGYWPLEDGGAATQLASPMPGVKPGRLRASGSTLIRPMDWGADSTLPGSGPMPTLSTEYGLAGVEAEVLAVGAPALGGAFWTRSGIPGSSTANGIFTQATLTLFMAGGSVPRLMITLLSWPLGSSGAGGTADTVSLRVQSAGDDGIPIATVQFDGAMIDGWRHIAATFEQSGSDITVDAYLDGSVVATGTFASATLGLVQSIRMGVTTQNLSTNVIGPISVGHPTVLAGSLSSLASAISHLQAAGLGWVGEPAAIRVERLCAEDAVPIHVTPGPVESTAMGPQPAATLLDLLRECEATDLGILGESRGGMALTYLARGARYNLAASMSVDLSTYATTRGTSADVLSPVYDDQPLRNEVTVSRVDGTSVTAVDQASIDADGRYDDSVTVNVAYDVQLPYIAGWLVAEGTVDEYRNPALPVDLAANPDLIDAWLSTDAGHRVQRTNPPAPHPPGVIDQIVTGYSESMGPNAWTASATCLPASPWTVGVVEDEMLGRADTDGSRWVGDVDAGTDTSALVLVTAGPPWITTANQSDMFPFDIRSAGVVLSVTGIAAAVADVYARTVAAGSWGTATTGQSWSVVDGTASNFSVSSGAGRITLSSTNAMHTALLSTGHTDHDPRYEVTCPVVPSGAAIAFWVYARWVDGSNNYYSTLAINTGGTVDLRLFKRVAGSATQLGSTVRLSPTHSAGNTWVLQIGALGSTIRCRAWRSDWPEERGWFISVADTDLTSGTDVAVGCRRETGNSNGSQTMVIDNFAVPSLQTFTLSSTPVNGVTKTVPAGEPLSLAHPWRLAL